MNFQDQIRHMTQGMLNIERLWEFASFNPNPEQRKAILHVDGPLYLTAGPGSGKTRVLLWRTLNLIVFHDIKPDEIFLSTFTEKAAHQLKEGLQAMLGIVTNLTGQPYDLTQMYVGTVHSLCQRILTDRRHFSIDRYRNRPPRLMDQLGQYFHLYKNRIWNSLVQSVGLNDDAYGSINAIFEIPSESKYTAVTNCQGFFNRLSEECIDPMDALQRLQNGDEELREYLEWQNIADGHLSTLLQMYAQYKQTLLSLNNVELTDFALLQQAADEVLDAFEGSGQVFKHVIVDEYQDTNSIQERLFFKLANGHKNICVVGDDDQALYRFRGATVENFVQFPTRCEKYLGMKPRRISLAINYRSRERIVDFYTQFMTHADWSKNDGSGEHYRVADKNITASSGDTGPSVVASTAAQPEAACREIAHLVRQLIDERKVENANQIAFLFPSMKYRGSPVVAVERMKRALEDVGLQVYAPRAGRFLEVDEAYDIFGVFVQVFGRPPRGHIRGHDYANFTDWLDQVEAQGKALMDADPQLEQYVKDRREELETVTADYEALLGVAEHNRWSLATPYDPRVMKRVLYNAPGLSEQGKKLLASAYLDRVVEERAADGNPFSLEYIIKRVTSIDWTVLDLFYRICGFENFKRMFDLAESGVDEGPAANLGLITQYLARFMDEYIPLVTADVLVDGLFRRIFFLSYLFALYRLGESEYEDVEDPFPKGRIPFLTIHQAKGLEFPVVVLGNPRKDDRGANRTEQLVRPFLTRDEGEPLDRMAGFDIMRMFYVALSRAQNLLVIAHYRGRGQRINPPFQAMLDSEFPRIPDFDIDSVPSVRVKDEALPKSYSFTADYLNYKTCPRQYMIFRKYGFVSSRSQTMFFGSLVHRTLEDLHHELIRRRQNT